MRLEAVGQDVFDVVADEVGGDGFDAFFRFEEVPCGAVLFLDGQDFLVRAFPKKILEFLVECMFVPGN